MSNIMTELVKKHNLTPCQEQIEELLNNPMLVGLSEADLQNKS